jgi:DNA-binding CsgD family transcriptional regulator
MGQLPYSGAWIGADTWPMTDLDRLADGRAALEAGRWSEARAAFSAAVAAEEAPEALDGMAVALWWLGETRASVAHAERAYAGFRRAGDAAGAAATAAFLCMTWASNFDNHAVAGGWLARAERVAGGLDPNPLRGWLWLLRGYLEPDPGRAHELHRRVLELARASGDVDLELCALGDLGVSLVTVGRQAEGLALIDEAMAGTLGGEHLRPDTAVVTCCDMLVACELAADLERAAQWCQVADRFIARYGCPFLYARCRTLYGGVLLARGRWAEAEGELLAAVRMAEDAGPGPHADALARLADLRLRQGRLEEALALLPERGGGRAAARTAARLRLALGEPAVAAAGRLAALAEGDRAGPAGGRGAGSLAGPATDGGQLAALAAVASARLAADAGDGGEAGRALERALEGFSRLDLPHETAQVRLELARVLAATNPGLAVAEAGAALHAFERLGAAGDADAAAALLRSLGAPGRTGPRRAGTLTRREQEVLALVGLGLSNPEIARRLFISRKTAAHHVSNVLAKLGVRNRAGTIVYATRRSAEG